MINDKFVTARFFHSFLSDLIVQISLLIIIILCINFSYLVR